MLVPGLQSVMQSNICRSAVWNISPLTTAFAPQLSLRVAGCRKKAEAERDRNAIRADRIVPPQHRAQQAHTRNGAAEADVDPSRHSRKGIDDSNENNGHANGSASQSGTSNSSVQQAQQAGTSTGG